MTKVAWTRIDNKQFSTTTTTAMEREEKHARTLHILGDWMHAFNVIFASWARTCEWAWAHANSIDNKWRAHNGNAFFGNCLIEKSCELRVWGKIIETAKLFTCNENARRKRGRLLKMWKWEIANFPTRQYVGKTTRVGEWSWRQPFSVWITIEARTDNNDVYSVSDADRRSAESMDVNTFLT